MGAKHDQEKDRRPPSYIGNSGWQQWLATVAGDSEDIYREQLLPQIENTEANTLREYNGDSRRVFEKGAPLDCLNK